MERKAQALAEAKNGVVTPLYFDRQVIRAEDLTLDRRSHDRELARMRRLLHGWGVVAGLIPVIGRDDSLTLSAGYGITRTGDEIYLTEALTVPDITGRVWGCCGPGPLSCEVVDPDERRRRAGAADLETVTAWLVARPAEEEGSLRPGVAEGCGHPANRLRPSRACDVVSIELLCALPPSFAVPAAACDALAPFFCAAPPEMLPMPAEPPPEDNLLVLGRILAGAEGSRFQPLDRRAVLPLSVVQDWLQACICPLTVPRPAEPPTEPGEVVVEPPDRRPPDRRPPVFDRPFDDFRGVLVANGFRLAEVLPPERLRIPDLVTDVSIRDKLAAEGIATPAAFLEADEAQLAATLGRTVAQITEMKAELADLAVFARGPGF
ncbi:hypothetical protein LV780_21290 (plasmid) [Cereibacter azotoformans]|uniref:Uncharacterized protein n=1 Tax=Cereibacter azotoformans TaxID=43057 RepID=A0A2T5JUQ3_9RHOB|nr:hypothetical protein [Cereibacter azotoformans]AXQ96279.1 hypothetical protein D0Z66_21515 [Cereibacter sphaeroides]PTR13882.1 hypothetical protein C8J28_11947 [Cereibacter azotoformans]UIJ33163.1 hypothetical protein LV780_21290 [Cereibacter azotoformans]